MGRSPGFNEGTKRGAWTAKEDKILSDYIKTHGEGKWINVPKQTGLRRCGKACRLRWLNYLRPDIKRGNITQDEVDLIIRLHKLLGNRWSLIAGRLPGRTDNEIKNYWNTNLAKREQRKELSVCQNGKMTIAEAEFLHDRELKPITEDRDSNVAIVGSSYIDEQPSPVNSTEENESNFLLDFDVDVGQITFSEFMDADFTNFNMFDMNGLTQLEEGCNSESAAFSTETMATQVNWNASDKSSETPTYSSEALWSSSDCFEISSHSEQGSWCDFLDLVEECIIWD